MRHIRSCFTVICRSAPSASPSCNKRSFSASILVHFLPDYNLKTNTISSHRHLFFSLSLSFHNPLSFVAHCCLIQWGDLTPGHQEYFLIEKKTPPQRCNTQQFNSCSAVALLSPIYAIFFFFFQTWKSSSRKKKAPCTSIVKRFYLYFFISSSVQHSAVYQGCKIVFT